MFRFLQFLDHRIEKLSTPLTSFSSLNAKGMQDDSFQGKIADPYEKGKECEKFRELLKLGREH